MASSRPVWNKPFRRNVHVAWPMLCYESSPFMHGLQKLAVGGRLKNPGAGFAQVFAYDSIIFESTPFSANFDATWCHPVAGAPNSKTRSTVSSSGT
jgi:hypothetical protein